MWRIWTPGWGPRAWWTWFRDDGFPVWLASKLPRRVAYFAFIRVYAKSQQAPGDEYITAAKAWEAA